MYILKGQAYFNSEKIGFFLMAKKHTNCMKKNLTFQTSPFLECDQLNNHILLFAQNWPFCFK
jgi:hypothetical protein